MSEMVDRAAKAMSDSEGYRPDFMQDNGMMQARIRKMARAAIAAMREASDAMIEAAYGAASIDDHWQIEDSDAWAKSWGAAIDAALAKTEEDAP